MRWFKHMTASVDDEKLSALMDEYGLEGYGFWWRIVEIVGALIDESSQTSAQYSPKKWGSLLRLSPRKFQNMAEFCANLGLFSLEISEKYICINMPNILKFRDEWTRKQAKNSGVTPEQLRKQIQNTDTEEESSLRSDSRPRSDEPDVQAKPKKSRTPLPELAEDSEAYRLAVYMRAQLAEVLPTFKDPNLQSWARDFDVALRNDERMGDARFVAQVIKWVAADSFWRTNCQCPATLRKQFDKLTARMAEEAAKARASPPGIVAAGGRPIATTQYQKDRQSSENIAKLYLTLKSQEQTNGNENEHSAGAVFDVPCLSTAHG